MPIIEKNIHNLKFQNNEDEILSFSKFLGKYLILYFYPRDNTSGCTKEAKDFTELKAEFGQFTIKVEKGEIYFYKNGNLVTAKSTNKQFDETDLKDLAVKMATKQGINKVVVNGKQVK